MRLLMVRHGDAHAGLRGIIAGPRGCRGLTDLGREQAARLRDHLDAVGLQVDALVASELPRAIETARIIGPALGFDEPTRDCGLCEVHVGEADGVDWDDHVAEHGSLDMLVEPDRPFAPGGDSWNSFHRRVDETMAGFAAAHPGQSVLAACHAGVIAASLRVRLGLAPETGGARLVPDNTSLTEWEHDEATGTWTLRSYNETPHLPRR